MTCVLHHLTVNLGRGAFEAMAHVVSVVHRSLEAAQDSRGHCPLLAAYVYYAFRLPGTELSLPGGELCVCVCVSELSRRNSSMYQRPEVTRACSTFRA